MKMNVYKVKCLWFNDMEGEHGTVEHDGKLIFAESYSDAVRKIEDQMGNELVAIEYMEELDADDIIDIDYLKDDIEDLIQYVEGPY